MYTPPYPVLNIPWYLDHALLQSSIISPTISSAASVQEEGWSCSFSSSWLCSGSGLGVVADRIELAEVVGTGFIDEGFGNGSVTRLINSGVAWLRFLP